MYLVIGSGPAGVFAARALLDHGVPVTMLDTGLQLESERQKLVDEISSVVPGAWPNRGLDELRTRDAVSDKGVERKLVHGSDYPYREPSQSLTAQAGCTLHPSYSRGGHSNVWGGAILPYRCEDIADWPFAHHELDEGYARVLECLPYSARSDDLADLFPLLRSPDGVAPPSRQARAFLEDLQRSREHLSRSDIHFGTPRLAMRPASPGGGCQQCALCLHGCPYDQVYSTRWTLSELERDDRFTYVSGVIVEELREHSDGVEVLARTDGEGIRAFTGDSAYIGAGVLGTARILTRSLRITDAIEMLSSEHFLLPFLRYRSVSGVANERLHTLSQLFVEIMKGERVQSHLQFYGYNDFYEQALAARLGRFARFARIPSRSLLGRLFAIQGYLHSDASSRVRVTWNPDRKDVLSLEGIEEPRARLESARIHRKLFAQRKHLRGVPLGFAMSHGKPGSGAHLGGSFPMRENPGAAHETDSLGRPRGSRRVHIVDSSTFPSIAPTTITLTVMANAYRIASKSLTLPEVGIRERHVVV